MNRAPNKRLISEVDSWYAPSVLNAQAPLVREDRTERIFAKLTTALVVVVFLVFGVPFLLWLVRGGS